MRQRLFILDFFKGLFGKRTTAKITFGSSSQLGITKRYRAKEEMLGVKHYFVNIHVTHMRCIARKAVTVGGAAAQKTQG